MGPRTTTGQPPRPDTLLEWKSVGPSKANSEHMGSTHKGEVVFVYWVPNPWHGRALLDVPVPEMIAAPCVTTTTVFNADFDEGSVYVEDDKYDVDDYARLERLDNDDGRR